MTSLSQKYEHGTLKNTTDLIRLTGDTCEIDGDVLITPEFKKLSHLAQLDLLNDWIGLLEKYREAGREEYFSQMQ